MVTTKTQRDNGNQKRNRTFVMSAQSIYEDASHAGDIDLFCHVSWDSIHAFDWSARVPNTTVDVLRGIQIGLQKDKEGVRSLLIRFVDTELEFVKPSSGAWYNWKDQQPSVWAIALTAPTVRKLGELILTEEDLLIHREPWTEPSPWFAEARWIKEGNTLSGVQISLQASQDVVPQIHIVKFLTKGHYFRLALIQDQSPDSWDQISTAYLQAVAENPLPPNVQEKTAPLPWKPATKKVPIRTDYKAEGKAKFSLDIDGAGATTIMFQSRSTPSNVIQVITSGKIAIGNPTDADFYLKNVTTEYSCDGGNTFHPCADTAESQGTFIGNYNGTCMVWGKPHAQVSWQENQTSRQIPRKSIQHCCIKAAIEVVNATAYSDKPFNMRLHTKLAELVTIRAKFMDQDDNETCICWDYSDDPLPARTINSYPDILTNEALVKSLGSDCGVGANYECLLWKTWDDPMTCMRSYVVVTKLKGALEWFIRAVKTTGSFPTAAYINVTDKELKRLVYNATSEVVDMNWGAEVAKFSVLVDLERCVAYGLSVSSLERTSSSHFWSICIYLDQSHEN